MIDNELLLFDRLEAIKTTISKYGEENFYLGFSGGKDSTILHYLLDMALPGNRIPRVYANTGIELNMIRDFVLSLAQNDERIVIIKPSLPIKQSLERDGYPFKSKSHSYMVEKYQRLGETIGVLNYLGKGDNPHQRQCPKILRYQFTPSFTLKVSDSCCLNMKEKPLRKWAKENNKTIAITGIMASEGGRRTRSKCFVKSKNGVAFFNPLMKVTKEFEDWLIEKYDLKICGIYKAPYNFDRTGCKGCPFALNLQHEMEVMEKFFPSERKQCEFIWKPVYDEYRRLNYRLKGENK